MISDQIKSFILDLVKTKKNVIGGSLDFMPRIKNNEIISNTKVIRIYVSKKLPMCMLSTNDLVPRTVMLNSKEYETDVVEIGEVYGLSDPYPNPRLKYRPLVPGISTMNSKSNGACSLGFFAIDKNSDQIVQLSNQHCFGLSNKASIGDLIVQPSILDSGSMDDVTGQFIRGVELKFSEFTCPYRNALHSIYRRLFSIQNNRVDVSCASINNGTGYSLKTLNGVEIVGWDHPTLFDKVWSYGRSSGYSYDGIISDVNGMISVQYDRGVCVFEDIILGYLSDTFKCIPGDSGSPLFKDNKIIGLRFAGSNVSWIACKWSNIMDDLNVSFP